MAIQSRRGAYGDFDPDKMLPGEWASVLKDDPKAQDGKAVYMCFSAGDVKRMATYEDMKNNIQEATAEIIEQAKEEVTKDTKAAKESAAQAESSAKTAEEKASAAEKSASNAEKSAETSKSALASSNKNFSDQYTKKTYKKGETCIQDNVLYEANADINPAEDWNAAHWTETSVEKIRAKMRQELDAVNANIANITPDDTAINGKPWTSKHIIDMLCPPLEVSGNPVQCYPVPGYPLGITASWEPVQEGSGDPSPDNIRPIKGRDSVTVMRYPTNILKNTAVSGEKVGVTVTVNDDGSILLNGTSTSNFSAFGIDLATITFVKGITYTISGVAGYTSKSLQLFTESSYAFPLGNRLACSAKPTTETAKETEKCKVHLYLYPNITYDNVMVYPMIIIGENKKETYTPNTIENTEFLLTLPETICAGSVDAITGEGQKEWEFITLDGTEIWEKDNNGALNLHVKHSGIRGADYIKCNMIKSEYSYSGNCLYVANGEIILFGTGFGSSYATINAWKSYLATQYAAGTPVQIAYKLATPTSFQSGGTSDVSALAGINTILTDADSLTVTARKDPVHLFDSLSG